MRTNPRPEEVRQLVEHVLEEFGAIVMEDDELDETILIDEGRLVARSYRTEGYLAMWLVGECSVSLGGPDSLSVGVPSGTRGSSR